MGWIPSIFENTKAKGDYFERQAEHFLSQQGLTLISRNYHCKFGEIDLIMQDKTTLVFVEVKYRKSNAFGGALNALSQTKQQRLTRTLMYYLKQHNLESSAFRVDFVAINGQNPYQFTWLKSVF